MYNNKTLFVDIFVGISNVCQVLAAESIPRNLSLSQSGRPHRTTTIEARSSGGKGVGSPSWRAEQRKGQIARIGRGVHAVWLLAPYGLHDMTRASSARGRQWWGWKVRRATHDTSSAVRIPS